MYSTRYTNAHISQCNTILSAQQVLHAPVKQATLQYEQPSALGPKAVS